MMKLQKSAGALALFLIALGCEQSEESRLQPLHDSPIFKDFPAASNGRATASKYGVFSAEYIASGESAQIGKTIFFRNVGNKQLTADFVPGLNLDNTNNVSFYIDENRPSADLSVAVTSRAIKRAMNTWDGVNCSELGMFQRPSDNKLSTGFISAFLGFGGSYNYVADVVHAGWLPAPFFDLLATGGSTFILGVTFTIIFTDDVGNAVDLDNNGKADVAWREIYYNDFFPWRDGAHYDVETIALHEAGHGLSQAHFGKAFANGNGKVHFSPRAVMNAAYSGIQTSIDQTDNGGHCSIWSSWPNK